MYTASDMALHALQSILQRLQQCITLTVLEEGQVNGFMHHAVELMSLFHKANQRTHHVQLAAFYNDAGMQEDLQLSRQVPCLGNPLWPHSPLLHMIGGLKHWLGVVCSKISEVQLCYCITACAMSCKSSLAPLSPSCTTLKGRKLWLGFECAWPCA